MPSPLAPRIRLASRFNWPSVVPYLSKLDICLDPSAAGTSGCKELFRQANSKKMRGFYPKCAVTMTLSEADPVIKAEFVDGNKAEFDAKHMDMFDITEVLHESAAAIRRADEVAGEFREVHNVPDAER